MDTNLQIKTVFNLDTGIIPISHIGMKYNTKLTYECIYSLPALNSNRKAYSQIIFFN